MKKLVVGTRNWLGADWTHVDIDSSPLWSDEGMKPVDIVADAGNIPLEDGSVDLLYSQECLEHIPRREYGAVLDEWVRLLKVGGVLHVEVPDFLLCCEQVLRVDTLEMDRGIMQLFYGGQENKYDYHFNGFTPRILRDDFEQRNVSVTSIKRGDEAGWLQVIGEKR